MNTYGKAVVAFAENERGFAILYSYGAVRLALRRVGPARVIRALTPNPSHAIMVWEGEFDLQPLDTRVDGRWRECSRAELDACLRAWARPDAPPDPDDKYGDMLVAALTG
jgi:hypothetical protein